MKRIILIGLLLYFALPTKSFGEESQKGIYSSVIDARSEMCKGHFDILPYVVLAIGLKDYRHVNSEVVKSLEHFGSTGKISLTEDQSNDPVAVSCATYAEGLMAGGIGRQLFVSVKGWVKHGEGEGKAFGEAIGKVVEGIAESIGVDVFKSIQSIDEEMARENH